MNSDSLNRCILAEADACQYGELGALLRCEKLYSNQLYAWRREHGEHGVGGLRKSMLATSPPAQRTAPCDGNTPQALPYSDRQFQSPQPACFPHSSARDWMGRQVPLSLYYGFDSANLKSVLRYPSLTTHLRHRHRSRGHHLAHYLLFELFTVLQHPSPSCRPLLLSSLQGARQLP